LNCLGLMKKYLCNKFGYFASGKIKELLSAELDVPASQMELHGWIHKNDAMIQDTVSQYSIGIYHIIVDSLSDYV